MEEIAHWLEISIDKRNEEEEQKETRKKNLKGIIGKLVAQGTLVASDTSERKKNSLAQIVGADVL